LVDELGPTPLEEADLVGPCEQHRDAYPARLALRGCHQCPAHTGRSDLGSDGQAAHLGDIAPQDVKRSVAREPWALCRHHLGDEEVTQVLEDVLHGSHQHATLTGPVADVLEDQRHVLRAGVAHLDGTLRLQLYLPRHDTVEPHRDYSFRAARAAAMAARTRVRAGPPTLSRALTTVSRSSALNTDSSMRSSTERSWSSVSSSSETPLVSASATSLPTTWCASRNGTPDLTRWSARSVALEKPDAAAFRMRSALTRVRGSMAQYSRRLSSAVSRASNSPSLSSCMSLL